MSASEYHYTESGLDNVYLVNGYKIIDGANGKSIAIQDIDGLHNAIGRSLVTDNKRLSGKDIRFLRIELLLSQVLLAQLLQVDEQTVARWEKGKTKMPGTADAALRLLYLEHIGGNEKVSELLRRIADINDDIDRKMILEESDGGWDLAA